MRQEWKIKDRLLKFHHKTLIMGVLNVTPDSFSDGGSYPTVASAVERALEMERQGADIIDIGGESTRPNYTPVGVQEEIERVLPVIEELRARTSLPISIDTMKSDVARAAVNAGADIINDVWGMQRDPDMARVAGETGCGVIIGHNRECTGTVDTVFAQMYGFFETGIRRLLSRGVERDKICIDPDIGFGKTYEENLYILKHLDWLKLSAPYFARNLRKSVIGLTLDLPASERLEGTIATSPGPGRSNIVQVHDVKEVARAMKMTDAVLYQEG
ncbi:MAG: dihydropteroate synthase [[Clostridium] leptum]